MNQLNDDLRRIFREFEHLRGAPNKGVSNVYAPALDVVEAESAIEVYVDLPGVAPDSVRVLCKGGNLLIVGEKLATEPHGPPGSTFHLVERGFGRFARVIPINVAFDASRARAALSSGELRVTLPRIDERRGREIVIHVEETRP